MGTVTMQIDNIDGEYYHFVDYLCKDGDEIIESLTPNRAHLLHMVLGLVGEVNEVREVLTTNHRMLRHHEYMERLTDELGDVLFYTVGCANITGVGCTDTLVTELTGSVSELATNVSAFAEYTKKLVMYSREWDEQQLQRHILNVYACIEAVGKRNGITTTEMITVNKRKLSTRYAGGYSDGKANNKLDKR